MTKRAAAAPAPVRPQVVKVPRKACNTGCFPSIMIVPFSNKIVLYAVFTYLLWLQKS